MSKRGYLGKISAILTADSRGLSRGFADAAKDTNRFARSIQSTISGATSRAGRAFDDILTPLQKLQRALKAGVGQDIKIVNQQEVRAILQFVDAAERIAKPLANAKKDFSALSSQVQGNFTPALQSAQKVAEQLRASIASGAKISERDFANVESRVNRVAEAIGRLSEASRATRSLASGSELRFQQPGFLQQTSRAATLQQQAAALSPEQIQGSGVAALVGQQRQAAQEAERLLATLERIRTTRNGDAQAAEAAYNRQVAGLRSVNDQLEREIALSQEARARGAAVQAFDTQQQNRFVISEGDRRSGVAARRNANAFEDATAAVMARPAATGAQFGPVVRTMESELARARAIQDAFRALPAETQRQLEEQKSRFDVVANSAQSGSVGIGTFTSAIDRLEASVAGANEELERLAAARELADTQFRPTDGNPPPGEVFGPTRETFMSSVNPQQTFLRQLGGEITAVRNQLQELPGVAGQLGPTVDNLTTRWNNLRRAGLQPTVDDLQRLRTETQAIQAALTNRGNIADTFSRNLGGAGAAGLNLGIDERQLRGVAAEFEFLQGRLAGVSAEARGPLVAAMQRYREVVTQSFRDGTIATERGQQAIELARQRVVRLGGDILRIDPRRLGEQLQRVGDVGRGSLGNVGLAIQQAAFAFEDFFSVTGGLDQRIRAAGNNISQLGFILGGTRGLILGISAAITAQLIAGFIKWYNNGVTVEDQTKAVNDALAKQKSLVDELARAFESLGDSIANRAFSQSSQQARKFAADLAEIAKAQRELREARIAEFDPNVSAERITQARLARELGAATNPATAARLQLELARSRQRERDMVAAGVTGRPMTDAERGEAVGGLRRTIEDVNFALLNNVRSTRPVPTGQNRREEARQGATEFVAGVQGLDTSRQIEALRERQRAIESIAPEIGRATADQAIAEIESVIRRITDSAVGEGDKAIREFFKSANRASTALEVAQSQVADAIKQGAPSAIALQGTLERLAKEIDSAQKEIKNAQTDFASSDRSQPEIERRNERVARARRRIDRGREARAEAVARANELEQRSILNPQGTLEARRQQALSNIESAGAGTGIFARQMRELEARRVAVQRSLEADPNNPFVRRRAERDLAAINAETAAVRNATESLRQFADVLDRLSNQLVDTVASEARSAADQARRDANRAEAEFGNGVPGVDVAEEKRRRYRLEQIAQDADRRRNEVRRQNELEREKFEMDAAAGSLGKDLQDLIRQRDEAQAVIDSGTATTQQENDARRRREDANREIDSRFRQSDAGRNATQRANEVDVEVQRQLDREESRRRGREARLTDAERAAREFGNRARDINESFKTDVLGRGMVLPHDKAARDAALNREAERAAQQVAPMIMGFREERMNALLQGPSRAALNVADVNTMEGNRELNRLLRGDDPNRDVNLVELQKQTEILQKTLEAIEQQGDGAVIEIRG